MCNKLLDKNVGVGVGSELREWFSGLDNKTLAELQGVVILAVLDHVGLPDVIRNNGVKGRDVCGSDSWAPGCSHGTDRNPSRATL